MAELTPRQSLSGSLSRAAALGLAVALAIALGGCGDEGHAPAISDDPGPRKTSAPLRPQATEVPPEKVDDAFVGVITASERADIGPLVRGEVMTVHVRPGDAVDEGQSLATLDPRRAQEDLRMTEATLRSERAALEQAVLDRRESASRLTELEGLTEAGAATEGAVRDARFAHQRARAAEARASALVAQWRTRRTQLERQLGDTELRAPFAGTVAERYIDPGGVAGPGDPVLRLLSSDSLWVRFAVPPHRLGDLEVAASVQVELEEPRLTVEAMIRQIAPETDNASARVFIDAELDLNEGQRASIQVGSAAWVRKRATSRSAKDAVAPPDPAPLAPSLEARPSRADPSVR